MALEIERKFLVDMAALKTSEAWQSRSMIQVHQGFLNCTPNKHGAATRVRLVKEPKGDSRGCITIKAPGSSSLVRQEFEYDIAAADAEQLLTLCERTVQKSRHYVQVGSDRWEVDVFEGDNAGLVVAEIELTSESQEVASPEWVQKEVTDDPRYLNIKLAVHPYSSWGEAK